MFFIMSEEKKVKYYNEEQDPMWRSEVESLMPWLSGRGVDIGCGARSIKKGIVRVDIDKAVNPDILASGDSLPFKDGEFDYLTSIHSFEHFDNQIKTLTEWLRVIKSGGIIGLVHPDINYTKKQNPEIDAPGLKENRYNKHWHEQTVDSFIELLNTWENLPFRIVDYGVACPDWSFYVILKKT